MFGKRRRTEPFVGMARRANEIPLPEGTVFYEKWIAEQPPMIPGSIFPALMEDVPLPPGTITYADKATFQREAAKRRRSATKAPAPKRKD
ncbi:hypothetical protein ABIC66_000201 [Caulobacter sp. 1776]